MFAQCDEDDIEQIAHRMLDLSHPKKLKLRAAIMELKNSKMNVISDSEGDRLSISPNAPNRINRSRSNGVIGLNPLSISEPSRSTGSISSGSSGCRGRRRRSDSVFITEREKVAMMKMAKFVKELEHRSAAVSVKVEELEREKQRNEELILNEFSELFAVLQERRDELMSTLHAVYHDKLDRFEQHQNELERMVDTVRSTEKDCNELIQSQSVMQYEANLGAIERIERRVVRKSNTAIHRVGPLNVSTRIKVEIDVKETNQILSLIGDVHEDHDLSDRLDTIDLDGMDDADEWKVDDRRQSAFRKREPLIAALRRSQSDIGHHRSRSDIGHRSDQQRRPQHRARNSREWKSEEYSAKTLSHIMDIRDAQNTQNIENRQNLQMKQRRNSMVSDQMEQHFELSIKVKDEWIECGENLEIVSSPRSRSRVSIPMGIAVRRQSNSKRYGSAFGTQIVNRGRHFWKIKVFCGDTMDRKGGRDGGDFSGFGVGFIPDRPRSAARKSNANPRNGWFLGVLSRNGSIGISGDCGIWCDGNKVSGTKGIAMRNRDIVNLCLDMDRGQVFVQRIEYRDYPQSTEYQYTVHRVKEIAVNEQAIDLRRGYRLGCALRRKGQSMEIMQYTTVPFEEWR